MSKFPLNFCLLFYIHLVQCQKLLNNFGESGTLTTQPQQSITFMKKLLKSPQLVECSLMTFQDRFDNSESVSQILQEEGHSHSYFTVKYSFPTEEQITSVITTVKKFHLSTKNISDAVTSSAALPFRYPITVSNYHKKSDQCVIILLFIGDVRPDFMKQIFDLLTPVYIPITRKDLDYYIFLTPPPLLDMILLMPELPAKIKFKLGLGHGGHGLINQNDKQLVVKTVCFFCGFQGSPKVVQFPGKFTKDFDYFPDFVVNLNGRVLRVSCPYVIAKIEADKPWNGINNAKRGFWKNLFEEFLTVKFNFSYHIFVSTGKDGNFGGGGTGVQLSNGTWIGVTGDIVAGRADLGIVTANTLKRIHCIDFTHSFFDFGFLTYVTAKGTRLFSPAALLWPFDLLMWFSIFLSTLVAFAVFTFIIKAIFWLDIGSGDSLNFARRGMISKQIWNFKYQVHFVLTSFLDQNCVMPTSTPLRIFVAIWLFFTLVVTTIYRTKLVSLLAFPVIQSLPTDFDQLAYSSYKVGFMKHGDSAYNTLAASTDPVYVKLLRRMEIVNGVGLECLEKVVMQKEYACIAYDFALRHLRERNLSEADTRRLVFAPAHTYNIFLGIATEGKSIYRINFGKWLSYTRAFHLQDVWEQRDMYYTVRLLKREWWFANNQSNKADKTLSTGGNDNLTLKHISGSFYILVSLLALCSCIFVAEFVQFYKRKWKWGGGKVGGWWG